jgi:hypothetical protein
MAYKKLGDPLRHFLGHVASVLDSNLGVEVHRVFACFSIPFLSLTCHPQGHRQLSGLVQRWTKADQVEFGKNVACSWTVKSPGMFRDGTVRLRLGL